MPTFRIDVPITDASFDEALYSTMVHIRAFGNRPTAMSLTGDFFRIVVVSDIPADNLGHLQITQV